MAEADPQRCDVSTQAQTSPLANDRSRENNDHAREIGEDLREGNRAGKGKKDEEEATEKENKKGLTKETKSRRDQPKGDKTSAKGRTAKDKTVQKSKKIDENKEKEDEKIDKNGNNREKNSRKRKASQEQKCTSESETTTTLADEQSPLSTTQSEKRGEVLEPTDACEFLMPSSATQEEDVPFQYSKTPGRLQKSPQSGQNLEKREDQSDISTQDEITSSKEENNSLKKEGKAALKDVPQLAIVEDTENKQDPEKDEEVRVEFQNDDLRDHENSFVKKKIRGTENIATGEQNCLSIEEDKECGPILSEAQDVSERKNACKDKRGEEILGVQDENKKKRKNKKESKRQITSAEEKVSPEEGKLIEEKRADENSDNQESRVLRRRAKETRQKPNDIDGEIVAKKCKTSVKYRKGREPAILDKSSPEAEQFPRDTEMSSREIDRPGVDRARLSRAATSRAPTDGTSQLPETEVLGGLTDGVATHGELIRDYKSDQGGSVLSDNRIRTVEETNTGGCVHKAVDEGKSSCSEKCQLGRELKENEKDKLPSKNRNTKRTEQELEAVSDVSEAKKQQDSDSTEVDYNTQLTRQTAKHTSRDTGRSKRNGQNPAEKTVTRSKEKAPNGKQTGKKKR